MPRGIRPISEEDQAKLQDSEPQHEPRTQVVEGTEDRALWETLKAAKRQPITFYDDAQGRVRTFRMAGRSARPGQGTRLALDMRPTPLPPDQLLKAYDEAGEFLSAIEQDHPILSNAILNNPNLLFLLPEISMMLGASELGVDVAGSLLEAMPNAVNYSSYSNSMFQTPVQQMFWNNVASKFDSDAKDVLSYLFAGLEEDSANRVASLAFAWLDNNAMEDADSQDDLLLRLWNWAEAEQQQDIHNRGFFGWLDAPQEFVENLVEIPVSGLVGWLGSPEDAIRRSGLTLGQQAAYQMGLDPDDTMWSISSGAIDAIGEIVLDPLNVLAGVGVGVKSAKTIPLGAKAIEKGRALFAAKSALPFLGRRLSPLKTRSLAARATYAFKAKTVDQLLDTYGSTRAGKEAFELLKSGNRARFLQRFPHFEKLPDTFYDAAPLLNSPEDMATLMQHVHWVDNMADPSEFNKASEALDNARSALERGRAAKPTKPQLNALELDVLKGQMKLDMMGASPSKIFVIADLPTKPVRRLADFVATKLGDREGHVANVTRRWVADLTQGVPSELNLFETRKSLPQLRQLMEHYGLTAAKKDELLTEFLSLDTGERMDFMLHKVVPAIGDATQNPLLRFNLVEFYRRAGVRAYAAGDGIGGRLDEAVDAAGNVTRLPFLDTQMQKTFTFPVGEVDQVIRRYNGTGHRLASFGLGRRGLVSGTKTRRAQLVQRLRGLAAERGLPEMDDEQLYQMAYSWLGQSVDARGWASKAAGRLNTAVLRPLDRSFRTLMLGARPFQWLFKVVILEEPIRAHVYEMPNIYSKPLGWASEVTSNHYLNAAEKWARKQIAWADDVRQTTIGGAKSVDEALDAIRASFGKAADDIIGDRTFRNMSAVNKRLGSWLHKASLDSQQARLIPGSNLSRKFRAWKVNKASNIKTRELLAPGFRPADDIQDIMHKNVAMLFGDELATTQSAVVPFHWDVTMSNSARKSYGQAWGGKVTELTESKVGKWGVSRLAYKARGEDIPASLAAEAFMETSTWKLMKGNIRRFYPNEASDAARVERFFDEKVEAWIDEVLSPVRTQANVDMADFLTEMSERRQFVAELNGHPYNIDLSSAGSARRKLADLTVDQGTFAHTTPFPEEIASVPFNFRFLDASGDKGAFRKVMDWNIQTFGEKATQFFNRRPFWRAQRRKWLDIYRGMGFPDELAATLATQKASRMTNYVMYDISEAPSVVRKLNNKIPFFGATFEVMSTWTYKLPVATGGYWALGAGGFARKIDRLMRAMVNTGIVKVTEDEGKKNYELQLWREPDTGTPLGDALSQLGYFIRRSPEVAISSLLALWPEFDKEQALRLSEAGYGFTVGNPLDPQDYGILSFAQSNIGLNPAQNWVVNQAMGKLFPAADVQRVESGDSNITLADLADKLDVNPDDLARANPGLFTPAEEVHPDDPPEVAKARLDFAKAGLRLPPNLTVKFGGSFGADQGGFFRIEDGVPTVHVRDSGGLYHEMAHAWAKSLTEETRNEFVEVTGLTAWSGSDIPWNERATEKAAEVIAWKVKGGGRNAIYEKYWKVLAQEATAAPTRDTYAGIFTDDIDPNDVVIPAGSLVTMPGSSLFESLVEDTFMPFGEIETPAGLIRAFVPAMWQHVARGLGLAGSPSDGAWLDDSGELGGLPFFSNSIDKASVNSQLLEAFYYLESTEGVFTEKIFPLQVQYEELVAKGGGAEADEIKAEITRLTDQALKRVMDTASGALILRGLGGGFFPNTGRAMRQETEAINTYWDTRDFAKQLQGNDADGKPLVTVPLRRVSKPTDVGEFFAQVGNWLGDETGDDSRKWVRENHPSIFAYLQPKTFWGPGGVPPSIESYEDYLDQIRSKDRKPVPLAVAIQRHLHAGIESDYWVDFVGTFGTDPEQAVANALDNYGAYTDLQNERYSAKDALMMSDDLHGGAYQEWLDGRGTRDDDKYESTEEAIDRQREAYDMLQELLDFEVDSTMTPAEIRDHRKIIKTTLSRFSEIIDNLEGESEDGSAYRNPYELAMNAYWVKIYDGFEKATDGIWDRIGESTDTEETSLLFEELKIAMNDWAQKRFTLFGRTDATYPSPLDIRWSRKNPDEQKAFAMKRATLPLEWLNLDDVARVMEFAPPEAARFFPQTRADMDIYAAWTRRKVELDEMAERGEITETDRRDAQSAAEETVTSYLLETGRQDEANYMQMWPIEQLHVLGLLPQQLEYLMPEVRFVKETLAAEERGPRTNLGDKLLLPLYNALMNRAQVDQAFGDVLTDLGLTLYDESHWDAILPRLIVDDFSDA